MQNFYRPQVEDEALLIQEGSVVEARILAVTEHLLRLECFGLECFSRVFELAQAWMADAQGTLPRRRYDAGADSQDPGNRWKTEYYGGRKIIRPYHMLRMQKTGKIYRNSNGNP